jgi:hypothetical protein
MLKQIAHRNTNRLLTVEGVMLIVQIASQIVQKWRGALSVAALGMIRFHN